ncbi:hypothetical protein BROUX41_006178 [Berkeleyomyces rouxiae]|uniref:uncharacterized protein n=1 Tax=Berkeleyomyces rouxiae TaxID=2035830 RepID=UPI003B7D883F
MAYKLLHRPWKARNYMYYLMLAELAGLVPILIIFGISQPNWYRTQFWRIGFENGWNSNPNMILYAYANYESRPSIPFVWSQTLTNFNVAISLITLFTLLTKLIGYIMHVWYPLIGLLVNIVMVTLYTVSTYGQIGPDHADDRYRANVVWYISKPCSAVSDYGSSVVHKCKMAKGGLAMTVYLLFIYLCNLGLAAWSMKPSAVDRVAEWDSDDEDDFEKPPRSNSWEMKKMQHRAPKNDAAAVPFTPRTQAFNSLGGNIGQPAVPAAYY